MPSAAGDFMVVGNLKVSDVGFHSLKSTPYFQTTLASAVPISTHNGSGEMSLNSDNPGADVQHAHPQLDPSTNGVIPTCRFLGAWPAAATRHGKLFSLGLSIESLPGTARPQL